MKRSAHNKSLAINGQKIRKRRSNMIFTPIISPAHPRDVLLPLKEGADTELNRIWGHFFTSIKKLKY